MPIISLGHIYYYKPEEATEDYICKKVELQSVKSRDSEVKLRRLEFSLTEIFNYYARTYTDK
jgi:hypothetical protein